MLEGFRRLERPTTVVAVMGGATPARMLATWPDVESRIDRPAELADLRTSETERGRQWDWLWRARFPEGPPWALWAELGGVDLDFRRETMERFVALRVVYPDGSLHAMARTWVNHQLVEGVRGTRRVGDGERG
ncbi:MAG TPA: hypothetical protein VJL31_12720 [Gemmatimonadales bacterium]|nr:hypothetical protein [Gemmatimonadales bacterium]